MEVLVCCILLEAQPFTPAPQWVWWWQEGRRPHCDCLFLLKQKPAGCDYTDLPTGILTAFPIQEIWSKQEKWGTKIKNMLFSHRQISVDRQELRGWQWPCVRFSVVPSFTDFTISRNYSCQIKCCDLLFTPRKPKVWKGLAVWLLWETVENNCCLIFTIFKIMNLHLHWVRGKEDSWQLNLNRELCQLWFISKYFSFSRQEFLFKVSGQLDQVV